MTAAETPAPSRPAQTEAVDRPEVPRCADCRFWDQQTPRTEWRATVRVKPLPGHGPSYKDDRTEQRNREAEEKYGRCQAIELLDSYDEVDEADLPLAFCRDGSDYRADLYTQAEFGCAMWESRSATTDTERTDG